MKLYGRSFLAALALAWLWLGAVPADAGIFPVYVNAGQPTNCGTVSVSTPCLDLTQTWNAGGVTFTGLRANITDTASAAGSLLMDLQVAGSSKFKVDKTGSVTTQGSLIMPGNIFLNAGQNINWGTASLIGEATNTVAVRNGTNAQTFNVYNTFTDASNYERGAIWWNGSTFEIRTQQAGTGASRDLRIASSNNLFLNTQVAAWQIGGSTGHFLAQVDATYDIGASGANRPRNIFASGGGTFGGTVIANTFSGSALTVTGTVATGTHTVAGLGAGVKAQRDFVTDATVAASGNFGAIVAGGGANNVPVYYDGTNWRIGQANLSPANDNLRPAYREQADRLWSAFG